MYSGMTPTAFDWQKKIRKFVNDELIPWEVHAEMNNGELPKEIEKKHREIALSMGLAGMGISKDSGGLGLNFFEQMISLEGVRLPGQRRHNNRKNTGPRNINTKLLETINSLK